MSGPLHDTLISVFVDENTEITLAPPKPDVWHLLRIGSVTGRQRIEAHITESDLRRLRDAIDEHLAREGGAR